MRRKRRREGERKTRGEGDGSAAVTVVKKKRGRPRKPVQLVDDGNKEMSEPGTGTLVGGKKAKYCTSTVHVP